VDEKRNEFLITESLMLNYDISLTVNGKIIEVTGFPKDFLTKTLVGAASSLKGVDEVDALKLSLKFGKVKMVVNSQPISLSQFPNLIIARTLVGTVSILKGVEGEVVSLEIEMKKI
jgi:hypothetical protein